MTDTIPNVPRELLDRCCKRMYDMMQGDLHEELRALLSAPSPAGVDGLDGVSERIAKVWIGHAHIDDLITIGKEVDAAQAIIDGLRGEVERLRRAEKNDAIAYKAALERQGELRAERDQQAQRIGELEGLLREAHQQVNSECMDWAKEYERRKSVQAERDTLKSMLREFAVGISKREMPTEQELNGWFDRIDAALAELPK